MRSTAIAGLVCAGAIGTHATIAHSLTPLLPPPPEVTIEEPTAPVYHIVLIDLKEGVSDAEIAALIADGETTIVALPGVLGVEMGLKARDDRDVHISDYDLGVYILFDTIEDLDAYGPHPEHQAFLDRNRHLWSGIQVIDFFGSPAIPNLNSPEPPIMR